MIRVVIIDDHKVVVAGLKNLIEYDGRLRVVASANDIRSGRTMMEQARADVLILDLRLPDSRGLEEITQFKADYPRLKILVLTGYGSDAEAQAMAHGADAFLTKELASDAIVEQIISWFPMSARRSPLYWLSDREREVGRLAASGLTNPEIGVELTISVNTVKTHLARVLDKLEVRDRTELARRWPEPL